MKKKTIIFVLLIITAILGYTLFFSNQGKSAAFLERYELEGLSVVEIIDILEQKTDEPAGFNASITADKLFLSDGEDTIELDIPENLFYLSVAPYINQTHPCANHSLVTCTGELQKETLRVIITDLDSEVVILDQEVVTSAKGFAGLWLPKDKNLELVVNYEGLTAKKRLSTFDSDNTCETTMQLS